MDQSGVSMTGSGYQRRHSRQRRDSDAYKEQKALLRSLRRHDVEPSGNPEWKANYVKFIEALKITRAISFKAVYELVKDDIRVSDKNFYNVVVRTNNFERCRIIVAAIYKQEFVFGDDEKQKNAEDADHPLYNAMVKFLHIQHNTEMDTADYVRGTYQLWRHSKVYPGQYVKGLVEMDRDEESGAIYVYMRQRFSPTEEQDRLHLQAAPDQSNRGYIFRRSGGKHYIMILSENADWTGANSGGIRLAIFHSMTHMPSEATSGIGSRPKNKVFSMKGFVLGVEESELIFSPVYLERVRDEPCLDDLFSESISDKSSMPPPNLYSEEFTPPKVLAFLKHYAPMFLG